MKALSLSLLLVSLGTYGDQVQLPARGVRAACTADIAATPLASKVQSLVKPCFDQEKTPFVVKMEVSLPPTKYLLTKIENSNLFLGPRLQACVLKAFEGKQPGRTSLAETFAPFIRKVDLEYARPSSGAPLEVLAWEACTSDMDKLRSEETPPLRDQPYRTDSRMQDDVVYRDLLACEGKLSAEQSANTVIARLDVTTKLARDKSTVEFVKVSGPSQSYDKCLEGALLKYQKTLPIGQADFIVDGVKAEQLSRTEVAQYWFARKKQGSVVTFYSWSRMRAGLLPR